MDIKSVENARKITSAYEKPLVTNIENKVQDTSNSVQDQPIAKEKVQKELEGLNKLLQTSNTHLKFMLHDRLHEYYVEVVDDQTNEVVREIPSKKMMDMVAEMHKMIGILVDEKR